jgi:hypothetical protein
MYLQKPATHSRAASRAQVANRVRNIAFIAGFFLLPVTIMAYRSNPPLGLTGAPGEGTCASCHSPLTKGSGVTIAFPGSLTYTPGGPAINLTVSPPASGGFELSSRVNNNNSQAGTLASGASSGVGTSGSLQYAFHTAPAAAFPLTWTPPATNVGNVVMYVVGVTGSGTFSNSYTLTPAGTPPSAPTFSASPSTLTFTYSGTPPPGQTVQVTSSGSAIAFTTAVSTASSGNWLSATSGGNTPLGVTVSVNPAGLSVGTYTGTVTLSSSAASNSPQTVGVTFNVTVSPPPATPNLIATPSALSFAAATAGVAVPAQPLQVTSSAAPGLVFTSAISTSSGGNWLIVTPGNGIAPASLSVSVNPSNLANGSYKGAITITSSGAGNSPLTVPVTLTIGATLPETVPLQFSLNVLDKQSGGADEMLLTGSGSVDSSGDVTGSGRFTRFTPGADEGPSHTVSTGTWTAASVVSFTPVSATSTSGGVLVLTVELMVAGGTTAQATMRIADTGSDSGVTLTITGGDTFTPTGTGHLSITAPTSGCPAPGHGNRGGGHEGGSGSNGGDR